MTKTANILRLQPSGPNGLETWEPMDPSELESGNPVQRGHLYHEIEAQGYLAGVWDCTAFTSPMMPYPVDEYMLFLEGELTMVLPDGAEIEIKPGDAFVIPKGFQCQWKQPGFVHKYFVILDGPTPAAENASLHRITVPDLAAPDAADVIHCRTDFLNAAGTMRVEVVACGTGQTPPTTATAHQMITVLAGALTLHDGAEAHRFATGETAYLHQGDRAAWSTEAGTHYVVASYREPDAA